MKIKTAIVTNAGGKKVNDDTVEVQSFKGTYVFVGDGLGGYAGGQRASRAACDAMMERARKGGLLTKEEMEQAAAAAEKAVKTLQEETEGDMKTTMVFLAMEKGNAMWMHVGDSRLYHFRDGKQISQTKDHSVSQMAVLLGQITQAEIRFHEDRNRVLRALGAAKAKPEISPVLEVVPADAFLLCTDGFWEYVLEEEMEQTLSQAADPQAWIDAMETILKSRVKNDNDNYTAAAVFCK